MKKLFSLAIVLLTVMVLTGCEDNEQIQQIADQLAQITELQDDLSDLQTSITEKTNEIQEQAAQILEDAQSLQDKADEIAALEQEILDLEAQLAELQAQVFDNVITFQLNDEEGLSEAITVGYNDGYTGTLFDLLDSKLTVGYTESEYGKMINSINELETMYGNYIAFYKNGEPSMVGVETATFTDGDVFSFQVEWWDMSAKAVNDAIELFLENQADSFVNETSINFNTLMALELLGETDEYVTDQEIFNIVDIASMTTLAEYYKGSYMLDIAGMTNAPTLTLLNDNSGTAMSWDYWYTLMTFNTFDNTLSNFTTLETTVLDYYQADGTSPYDLGVDAGGMALLALSHYDTTEVDALINEYATWISTDQLESGGFTTRDSVWGETTYPGTENAASMSQIILGLVANDINPTGTEYTQGTNNLITRLLEFQNTDGSFDYLFEDENADLMFSTPQAFLALVTYQEYLNQGVAVNPYS